MKTPPALLQPFALALALALLPATVGAAGNAAAPPASRAADYPTSVTQEGVSIRTTTRKGRVTIVNGSGSEIWIFVVEGERNSLAWIPMAVPGTGIAPGKSHEVEVGRLAAGSPLQVNWWHRGDKKLSDDEPVIWGPDAVRTSVVKVP